MVLIGDLHLAPGRSERQRAAVRALAAFIERLTSVAASGPGGLRLVLLGDTLDLPMFDEASEAAWAEAATRTVDQILDNEPDLMSAVAGFLAAGGRVDATPGNHDRALLLPRVGEQFVARLAAGGLARPGLSPWLLYEPGVLYAEHGHQHHDINALPAWLRPVAARSQPGAPLAWALEAPARAPQRPFGRLAAVGRVARAWLAAVVAMPGVRRIRRAYHLVDLPRFADATGLPADLLVDLDRLARATPIGIVRRLGLRFARGLVGLGRRTDPGYLPAAAIRVDHVLGRHDRRVPILAFGHSHEPVIVELGGRTSDPADPVRVRYVNPGAWSAVRPAQLAQRLGPDRHPFAVLTVVDRPAEDGTRSPVTSVQARLGLWSAVSREFEPFPAGDPPAVPA